MITAVVMVGEKSPGADARSGVKSPLVWVQDARRAAAADLVVQLGRQQSVERIVFISPDPLDAIGAHEAPATLEYVKSPPGPVHIGRYLAEISARLQVRRLLYFGGGSAPLMDDMALTELVSRLAGLEQGIITNNQFASDWAAIYPASIIADWVGRLPQDNMLGWVLSAEAGLPVYSLPATAANRLDIDTPTDLLTLALHPATRPHLQHQLSTLSLDIEPLRAALAVLATPASQVFISGRLSPEPWNALNKATRCWLRVVSEERGMVSSGRLERGEVYSLLAEMIEHTGLNAFFANLARQVQAAFIDTRVLMAHHGSWPAVADRFASDLGLVKQINDPWLREFTIAAIDAPIPIVLGGHGLMAGDLLAFCDLL